MGSYKHAEPRNALGESFCLLYGSGGEVKSLWSKYVGLHMRYKGENKGQRRRNLEQILKNCLSSNCRL